MKTTLPQAEKILIDDILPRLKAQPLTSHSYADECERIARDAVSETLQRIGVRERDADYWAEHTNGCAICRLGKAYRRLK